MASPMDSDDDNESEVTDMMTKMQLKAQNELGTRDEDEYSVEKLVVIPEASHGKEPMFMVFWTDYPDESSVEPLSCLNCPVLLREAWLLSAKNEDHPAQFDSLVMIYLMGFLENGFN